MDTHLGCGLQVALAAMKKVIRLLFLSVLYLSFAAAFLFYTYIDINTSTNGDSEYYTNFSDYDEPLNPFGY
jgi:hypothetical protein